MHRWQSELSEFSCNVVPPRSCGLPLQFVAFIVGIGVHRSRIIIESPCNFAPPRVSGLPLQLVAFIAGVAVHYSRIFTVSSCHFAPRAGRSLRVAG